MLIEAVEKRFGAVEALPAEHTLEFLTDNGGAYIAHDTRRLAPPRRCFESAARDVFEAPSNAGILVEWRAALA